MSPQITITAQNRPDLEVLRSLGVDAFQIVDNPDKGCFLLPDGLDAKKKNTTAQKHNLPILDIIGTLDSSNVKINTKGLDSLGRCVDRLGKRMLIYAINEAVKDAKRQQQTISKNHSIKAYSDDKHSIAVPSCYKVEFSQYLGEKSKDLLQIVKQEEKLILQSGAGTGKSTWLIDLANSQIIKELGCEYLVIVEPKTPIAQQLHIKFYAELDRNSFVENDLSLVWGQMKEEEIEVMEQAKIIVCVLDSLNKLEGIIDKCFLVVDEFHEISKDENYRGQPMFELWEYMKQAKRKLLLSATPDYLFTTNLDSSLGYSLVQGADSSPNTINLTIKVHSPKVAKRHLLNYTEVHKPNKEEGTTIIKFDSDKNLDAYRNHCKIRGLEVDYLNSKRAKDKEKNENYKSIMQHGTLAHYLELLLCTKLLESGVSFKFLVALMAIFDARSWQEITQLAFRPRHNKESGVNMINEVWLFMTDDTDRDTTQRPISIKDRFKFALHNAKKMVREFNATGQGDVGTNVSGDFDIYTREIDEGSKKRAVDIPAILYAMYSQSTKECSIDLLAKRIKRFDSRFNVEIETIDVAETKILDSLLEQGEVDKEEAKQAFFKLLQNDTENAVHATCYLSKNPDFKFEAKQAIRCDSMQKIEIVEFIKNNPVAFSFGHRDKVLGSVVKLINCGEFQGQAIKAVVTKEGSELREYVESKRIRYRHKLLATQPEILKGFDIKQGQIDKEIWRVFDQIRYDIEHHDKYKDGLTKKDICRLTNKAIRKANKTIKHELSDSKCMSRIKTLYFVEQERIGHGKSRKTMYHIGDRKFLINRGKT